MSASVSRNSASIFEPAEYSHIDPTDQLDNADNTRDEITNNTTVNNIECFLAISFYNFQLGITFYRFGYDKLELLHEVYEYYDFSCIRTILRKVEPTDVIISSQCDGQLMNFLKLFAASTSEVEHKSDGEVVPESSVESIDSAYAAYEYNQENRVSSRYKLHIISSRLFQYEQCKTRILAMNLPQMANMMDRNERFIYLTSNINFAETNTIKSLGVLLYFLEKNPLFKQLNASVPNFSYFNFYYVTMDQTTFEALEIFQQEWHPSALKKGIYKKEGLSVFGIFNTCSSKLGTFHLRKLFQQPITDFEVLVQRQDIIEWLINPANQTIKDLLLENLKHIKDISLILGRFQASNFKFVDFEALESVISNLIAIRNTITRFEDTNLVLFSQILQIFSNELEEVCNCLKLTVDYANSDKDNIEIRPKIDAKLDELKMLFNKLPEVLNRVLLDETEENNLLPLNFQNLINVYVPQIGFLLAVPLVEAQKVSNLEELGFQTVFCANDRTFYKNKRMKEFDAYYGDIMLNIAEQTRKVLAACRDFIFQRKKTLKASISLAAQLDAMIAMAEVAIKYRYTRPTLSAYGAIHIEGGRHPLHELLCQSFVPNPFTSDDDESKISIIFGPNCCGKSVYLKQISLIVYLAHIGSYVPAASAEITIVDQILSRIRTPESISTQLSSFKHDLNQIIMATKYATRRSLVVIDFFGKGTLSIDGFSLFTAVVKHWARSHHRPHIIISSQFNLRSTLSQSRQIKFYTFETMNSVNLFRLTECDQDHGDESSQQSSALLMATQPRIERLISDDTLDKDFQDAFPELDEKYQKYMELADFVMEESHSDQFIEQLAQMIKLLATK